MDIKKIYIDMDGVLADFDGGLLEFLGIEPRPQEDQPEDYQIRMWQAIRDYGHFYYDLKPMEGAIEAFIILYEKYGDACEILTGCPKDERGIIHAREDKIKWVRKYLSEKIKINLVLSRDKQLFAKGKEYILIDDYNLNLSQWRAAGGTEIAFTSWDDVLRRLL